MDGIEEMLENLPIEDYGKKKEDIDIPTNETIKVKQPCLQKVKLDNGILSLEFDQDMKEYPFVIANNTYTEQVFKLQIESAFDKSVYNAQKVATNDYLVPVKMQLNEEEMPPEVRNLLFRFEFLHQNAGTLSFNLTFFEPRNISQSITGLDTLIFTLKKQRYLLSTMGQPVSEECLEKPWRLPIRPPIYLEEERGFLNLLGRILMATQGTLAVIMNLAFTKAI
jgi:hypothetical protein